MPKVGDITLTKFKLPKSFLYAVEYDYDTYCPGGSCICEDDYCRCNKIRDAKVTGFSSYYNCFDFVRKGLSKEDQRDDITVLLYTRLWASFLKHPEHDFVVITTGGYYGEEVHDVHLADTSTIPKRLAVFNSLNTKQRVQYLLTLEYGYLLDGVSDVDEWILQKVKTKEISANPERVAQVQKESEGLTHFQRFYDFEPTRKKAAPLFPGFVLLPLPEGGGYRLIDGFHRYCEILKIQELSPRKFNKVWAIVPA